LFAFSGCGLEGFGPGEEIVRARDDCESKGEVESDVAEESNNIIIKHLVGENGDEGGHLDGGLEFAEEGGGSGNATSGEHHAHAVDGEVADEDDGEDPDRDDVLVSQDKEGEVDEHLVGQGIEKGAEVGDLLGATRPDAVDFVGNGCDYEKDEGDDFGPEAREQSEDHVSD